MPQLDDIFRNVHLNEQGELVPQTCQEVQEQLPTAPSAFSQISGLLPVASINLTPSEAARIWKHQKARVMLGPSAQVLLCEQNCPFQKRCPLIQISKAPFGQDCPFETNYVSERWGAWLLEFDRTPDTILESERITISNLVYLDVQEQRCLSRLAEAENAGLVSRAVKDIDADGNVVCWEDVVHLNAQYLDQITTRRRLILKDFELTPEMKTKKAKATGKGNGLDLASRQSDANDRLRLRRKKPIQTLEAELVSPLPPTQ